MSACMTMYVLTYIHHDHVCMYECVCISMFDVRTCIYCLHMCKYVCRELNMSNTIIIHNYVFMHAVMYVRKYYNYFELCMHTYMYIHIIL